MSSEKKSTVVEEQDVSVVVVRRKPTTLELQEEAPETATESAAESQETEAVAVVEPQPTGGQVDDTAHTAPERPAGEESQEEVDAVTAVAAPTSLPTPAPLKAAKAPVLQRAKEEVDFAALLGASSVGRVEQGEMVSGELVAISGEWAFVDLGAKTEGILAVSELKDADGNLTRGVGDQVEAFVVSTRGGEIKLSQTLGKSIRDYESLRDAYDAKMPVDGRVTDTNKGGYEVMVGGRRAFCPASQIELAYTEDPSVHVGYTYQFRVMEMGDRGKRIVVSRAALLREERRHRQEELRDQLFEGAILDGEVRSLQEYGAFIDLGGLEGLAHVSELSWRRIEHPSEVLNVGDPVEVKILSIKEGEKGPRISLSVREAQPHPWVAVGTKFVTGETYDGTVTRLEPFGAFVELGPGIEGLIHVSELSWEKRVGHSKEILDLGQTVRVYLKEVDHERKRIALSLKALAKDPWNDAEERYGIGLTVAGTVEKVQPFGVFLEVEPGITALIPASESGTGTGADLRREFSLGKKLTATVLSVDQSARRMSLSLKAAGEASDRAEVKEFFDKQKDSKSGGGFGTLGDLFGDKLGKE